MDQRKINKSFMSENHEMTEENSGFFLHVLEGFKFERISMVF